MIILLASSVLADKVVIFNLNYDNGKIALKEQIIKEGYYPDRRVQVDEGYMCGLKDSSNDFLYSFKFELPNKLYTDISDGNLTMGNIIILNETDFSFIMPYINEVDNIVCNNPGGYEIINEMIIKTEPEKRNAWIFVYIGIVLLGFIILYFYKKKRRYS
jgi:LPXTG-motif cell wall-anchored protein